MINITANEYMFLLSQWFVTNKLSVNIDKTCFTTFANQNVENSVIPINDLRVVNVVPYFVILYFWQNKESK